MNALELILNSILEYHEETKHFFERSARSAGCLDWANQPTPFRWYKGAQKLNLPLSENEGNGTYEDLFSHSLDNSAPMTLVDVARLLELSLGLSAWKSYGGSSWVLRMNPSSGNLHPTEAHLILPPLDGHPPGVYHYDPYLHQLELRRVFPHKISDELFSTFEGNGFFILLCSIFWREAWKYGERAYRYCQHDIGHAIAAVSFAARLSGWDTGCVNQLHDQDLERIAGFDKVHWPHLDKENPAVLLGIYNGKQQSPITIPSSLIDRIAEMDVFGEPNPLSEEHVDWEIIRTAAKMACRNDTFPEASNLTERPFRFTPKIKQSAAAIIRQRRSAQALDGKTTIAKDVFLDMLDRTIPRRGWAPFDIGFPSPAIHLFIFVHRVNDLEPGLYSLIRNKSDMQELQEQLSAQFRWDPVDADVPLFLLKHGDFRRDAMLVSCQQEIAADGCFSLGMIARFRSIVEPNPFMYRHLFWESGMIGQVLYLCAEAHSRRGTGIGCYFDDPMHELLGIQTTDFQSLYHFTIGGSLIDRRLASTAPYVHLDKARSDAEDRGLIHEIH